jgi:hypothetical protein
MKRTLALTCAVVTFAMGAAPQNLSLGSVAWAQQPPPPPPPPPAAGAASEANAHFKRGVELYGESDWATALTEFRRAYDIDPKWQVLYNIGETYFQLQDYANALGTLQKYLRDGGAQVSPARRDEVTKDIDKLKTRVATVEVTTTVPDIEITVDEASAGKTPLAAPLIVSAGRRRISGSRGGKVVASEMIEVAGGDAKKITLTIAEEAPAAAGKTPVVPWVVTGVLAAAAIGTGAGALVSWSSTKDALKTVPGDSNAISSDHTRTFALGLTTDILVGAAVVSGVVSIYLTVTAGKRAQPTPRVGWARPPTTVPSLAFQPRPGGASLSGTF